MLKFKKISKKYLYNWSSKRKKIEAIIARMTTITAPVIVSLPVGQVTLNASLLTSCINFNGLSII